MTNHIALKSGKLKPEVSVVNTKTDFIQNFSQIGNRLKCQIDEKDIFKKPR